MDKITMSGAIAPLAPTFNGHIATTMDAAILFEACLQGRIPHVPRRPHDRERQDLIASGNVFIYEEHASGIKRWTDGVSWSPSRILGNFLIYRELEKPFPPGEKKRALKKKKQSNGGINRPDRANSQSHSNHGAAFAAASNAMGSAQASDPERSLVGSLIDSYPFKENGLIKKTISIHYQGVPHHLVSYYSLAEALSGTMNTPSNDVNFSDIRPRHELLMNQNFRNPLDETAIFTNDDRGLIPMPVASYYTMAPAVQDLSPQAIVMSQPMAVASMPSQQPMHAAYPGGLEYEFFAAQQQQQQAPHPHQALPHLPEPHHHHHDAHQAQQQQQQQQQQQLQHHHHYQYEAQQPHHHHHQHHHHLQHQLQQQQQQQVQHHEDHQRGEYQRHFSVAEMQQPLHSHPSPEEEPQQPQHQGQQQQQPPSGGYAAQGGQWSYDPNDYYFS